MRLLGGVFGSDRALERRLTDQRSVRRSSLTVHRRLSTSTSAFGLLPTTTLDAQRGEGHAPAAKQSPRPTTSEETSNGSRPEGGHHAAGQRTASAFPARTLFRCVC